MLAGERGGYVCDADVAEVSVPATVQAAIAARIDRLTYRGQADVERGGGHRGPRSGRACSPRWASMRWSTSRWARELIDQVRFTAESRVCLPPSADSHGGLRITAQIGSRRAAPAASPPQSNHVTRRRLMKMPP